jgi:hypothetical protein
MQNPAAAGAPAAITTASGQPLSLPGTWMSATADELERERLLGPAGESDAGRQFARCFARWPRVLEHVRLAALRPLAANRPVNPNDPDVWHSRDEHAQAILRRHGLTKLSAGRLTLAAISELIAGQAQADRDAGLDWSTITVPPARLDDRLRRAHAELPITLDDPAIYAHRADQRHALSRMLGVSGDQADDLSRWVLAHPDQFRPDDLRCWRIGSRTWLELCDEQLPAVDRVEQPVGLFVIPAVHASDGWQLTPLLSLDAIRLLVSLGGRLERDLRSAVLLAARVPALLERMNPHTLHAGPKECLDSAGQLAQELSRELGQPVAAAPPRDKRDRWGRLLVRRRSYQGPDGSRVAEVELRAITFPARGFTQWRLGAAPRDDRYGQLSAAMDLGEAVQTAVERELPLLLSTEAAGHLKDAVRVGRMKGRPGVLTITTSDGLSASTRRLVAEQAVSELRALKRTNATVTLDAGARQAVRMTLARPLDDDPVLLGRQREMAALKVVGSGVDASAVGTGKTISSGRALAHRATTQPRFRGLVVAEGRLLGQWREELERGAPGRGLPPLAPNVELLVIADDRQVAGQIRQFDRRLSDRPGVVLAANSVLDRYPSDLQAICWHLLIADEALRYANPATEAHPGARPGALRIGRGLLASERHPARQERRAPRRARRTRARRPGDNHRAAEHPRGRRPHGRDPRAPAAGQLRPAPGARHPQGHAGLDAAGAPGAAARARPRSGARRAARRDPRGWTRRIPQAASDPAGAEDARGGQRAVQAGARRARACAGRRARQRRGVCRRLG